MGIYKMPRKSSPKSKARKVPKYAEGTRVTFKNGAVAEAQANGQLRIVKGAPKAYMQSIAKDRKYKAISKKSAERAFKSHYKNSPRYSSERGRKMARTYDLNHKSPVREDTRYRRSPNRYDYPGVDLGDRVRKEMSASQKEAARARAAHARSLRKDKKGGAPKKSSGHRGRPRGSKNRIQEVCGFN